MGIFRYSSGTNAKEYASYLVNGQKSGRNYDRNDLDKRVTLRGDLDAFQTVCASMGGKQDFLRVIFSCEEDHVTAETLVKITSEFESFLSAAYKPDDLCFYAEAHIPKILDYAGYDGKLVDRKTHVHIAIPTINLATREAANPRGYMKAAYGADKATWEYFDDFQEYQNLKYGLTTPKESLREKAGQAAALEHHKDKDKRTEFQTRTASVPHEIMQNILDENCTTLEHYKEILARYGEIKEAHSKNGDYFKVKAPGDNKYIRLNDKCLSLSFLSKSTEEKRAALFRDKSRYLEPIPRTQDEKYLKRMAELEASIKDWTEIRSREVRYINNKTVFYKNIYVHLNRDERKTMLDRIEAGEKIQGYELVLQAPVSSRLNKLMLAQQEHNLEIGKLILSKKSETSDKGVIAFLENMTRTESGFAKKKLEEQVLASVTNPQDYEVAMKKILSSEGLLVVFDDKDNERYTTQTVMDSERKIIELSKKLKNAHNHHALDVDPLIKRLDHDAQAKARLNGLSKDEVIQKTGLNEGQALALKNLCSGNTFEAVNGAAGTGKSYVLAQMHKMMIADKMEVHGVCLQGKTAEDLQRDSGIASRTIDSFVMGVDAGRIKLNEKSVIVLDEAGMVGSAHFAKLLSYTDKYNCRLRMVGDVYQLQAVSYGSAFQKITDITGTTALTEVMRQDKAEQREASMLFAQHKIQEGLKIYREHTSITDTRDTAIEAIVEQTKIDRETKIGSSIVICKTNVEREQLNRLIRDDMIDEGRIEGRSSFIVTPNGKKNMMSGDQVIFFKKDAALDVKNGTMGRVKSIDERGGQTYITFDINGKEKSVLQGAAIDMDYSHAITTHKSQGITLSRVAVLANKGMTANEIYVAMTRHKDECKLYVARDQFEIKQKNEKATVKMTDTQVFDEMSRKMTQKSVKDFVGDREEKKVDKSVIDSMIREHNMRQVIEREANSTAIRKINQEIDVDRLMFKLGKDKGLNLDKYQYNRENNTIRAGTRELTPVQFMTDEMHMDYKSEAMPYVRDVYAEQLKQVYYERQTPATQEEYKEFAAWHKVREMEMDKKIRVLETKSRELLKKVDTTDPLSDLKKQEIKDQAALFKSALLAERNKPNREIFNEYCEINKQYLAEKAGTPLQQVFEEKEMPVENIANEAQMETKAEAARDAEEAAKREAEEVEERAKRNAPEMEM